jgi:glycosyltransferase involved in cell wall biosynthesis
MTAASPTKSDVLAPDRPLRLLALTMKRHGISPNQRFRLEQWAPHLSVRHHITLDWLPFESPRLTELLYQPGHLLEKAFWVGTGFLRRAAAVIKARRYDGVVVSREAALIGPAFYERLISWSKVPLFYEFDDAIWMSTHGESVNGVFSKLRFPGKTASLCRMATIVMPGNSYLADYARRYNQSVAIIPTSIDLGKYCVMEEPASQEPLVIAWTGSKSTLVHFEHAREVLEKFARRFPIKVRVICDQAPARPIAGAQNEFVRWTDESEAEEAGNCHIGIMPLPDDVFTRGKCGCKALQFMATGRPVVISPVGMNVDLVKHDVNGLLASTEDEWLEALTRMAESRELRQRLGSAGRKTVEEGYSAQKVAAMFASAVRKAVVR